MASLIGALVPRTELGAPQGFGRRDWDVEAFLKELRSEGVLDTMRAQAQQAAAKRKALGSVSSFQGSQDDGLSASETEDWDRWTSSNTDSASTTTESEVGSEQYRDMDGQALNSTVAGRWGFKRFVGPPPAASAGSGRLVADGLADPLPFTVEGPDGILPGCREEDEGGAVEDAELEEFLAELEREECTEATAAAGWRLVMNRSTDTMQYCSWLRDPGTRGGTEYRGRMIIKGCLAETVRDFMLDEAHRTEWDENRVLSEQLEDWDENGCTAVRWVRRLPFFLRNREYVVARRLWSPEHRTFYCISRHTNHSSAPQRGSLVRVSSFHSSWRIRPVSADSIECDPEFLEGHTGELVEIITHHEEESGLQKDLARMGVAHGMWAHMQKMELALQAYVVSGRNAKHLLPVFLIQADARLGLVDHPKPVEKQQQLQLQEQQEKSAGSLLLQKSQARASARASASANSEAARAEKQRKGERATEAKARGAPQEEKDGSPMGPTTPPLAPEQRTAIDSPLQLHSVAM